MNIWSATALNTAPDSENRIHGDDLAKKYGFQGGLVPGVTISAYLVHPVIEHWGKDWLDRGYANCRITSPLYDKELFEVKTDNFFIIGKSSWADECWSLMLYEGSNCPGVVSCPTISDSHAMIFVISQSSFIYYHK